MNGAVLRVAVVGHTNRGNFGHAMDTAFSRVPGTRIIAVADQDESGRNAALVRTGAGKAYADYALMLRSETPDIVVIGPRYCDSHEELIMEAIGRGVRGILCEKPLASTLDSIDRIQGACRSSGTTLLMAHRSRENPYVHWAQKMIREEIGPLRAMRGHGKSDHRVGMEDTVVLGLHVFDQMAFFAGAPEWCAGHVTVDGRDLVASDGRDGPEGIGKIAGNQVNAYFAFPDGVVGHWESSNGDRPGASWYWLELHGERGIIALRNLPDGEVYRYPHGHWMPDPNAGAWERVTIDEWDRDDDGVVRTSLQRTDESNRRHATALRDLLVNGGTRDDVSTIREAEVALEMTMGPVLSHLRGCRVAFPMDVRTNPFDMLHASSLG